MEELEEFRGGGEDKEGGVEKGEEREEGGGEEVGLILGGEGGLDLLGGRVRRAK